MYFRDEFDIDNGIILTGTIFLYISVFSSLIYNISTIIFVINEIYGIKQSELQEGYHNTILISHILISYIGIGSCLFFVHRYNTILGLMLVFNIINSVIGRIYYQYFDSSNVRKRFLYREKIAHSVYKLNIVIVPLMFVPDIKKNPKIGYGIPLGRTKPYLMNVDDYRYMISFQRFQLSQSPPTSLLSRITPKRHTYLPNQISQKIRIYQ